MLDQQSVHATKTIELAYEKKHLNSNNFQLLYANQRSNKYQLGYTLYLSSSLDVST